MELYLQFGYGMMTHSEHLIDSWNGGTVILSPRDLEVSQMNRLVPKIHNSGGNVLLDPQFYIPHADHSRLLRHSFWPQDYATALFQANDIRRMLVTLRDNYNTPYQTPFFILPGARSSEVNDDWYDYYSLIINEAVALNLQKEIYMTLCLSADAINSNDTIHAVLEYLDTWEVEGCYLVPEPPNNQYLVDNPNWIVNLMDLVAGIRMQGKKVVVGYSNHQTLHLALAKANAIASGTWLNVRSFNIERFNNPEGDGGRRSMWYYCPQSLSEYQIPFLDMAQRVGILNDLRTDPLISAYAEPLFSGAQPSSVNYREPDSFRHYLQSLRFQVGDVTRPTFTETKAALILRLETARNLTDYFRGNGVTGRDRDFSNAVDATLSAINVFDRLRGMALNHRWAELD